MNLRCPAVLSWLTVFVISTCAGARVGNSGPATVRLSDLDVGKTQQAWGSPRKDQSVDGNPLRIAGHTFEHGLGTHADSALHIALHGGSSRLTAWVGVDDESGGRGSVEFRILADGREVYKSGVMRGGDTAREVDVDLSGVETLVLTVNSGYDDINYDHADWANAVLEVTGARPQTIDAPKEEPVILTPKPSPQPRINGARIFGVRPGSPVLYTIAATGKRPIRFAAENLPDGLELSPPSGRITGRVEKPGEYEITLIAQNELGQARRALRLVVGDTIALTPPMGWNSWNCWGCAVDEEKIRQAADAMVESGLADHGWQYINIDDCWMIKLDSDDPVVGGPTRDECGRILTNERFPDMKALTDYIHARGLKIGTYISPGPWTCQRFEGSWRHEQLDAQRFAE